MTVPSRDCPLLACRDSGPHVVGLAIKALGVILRAIIGQIQWFHVAGSTLREANSSGNGRVSLAAVIGEAPGAKWGVRSLFEDDGSESRNLQSYDDP